MSRITKGYLAAIIGITLWSTTGVFLAYLMTTYNMPALVLGLWRNLLVCAAMLPALILIRRSLLGINAAQLRLTVFYGFVLAVFNSVWVLSVKANGAAVATVLVYSSAGFTAILALLLFREKLGLPKIAAVLLSLTGCVLVSNAYRSEIWKLNPLGATTGLLSGVLFAAYTLIGKEASRRGLSAWTTLLYSFAIGSVFMLIFNLFPGLPGAAGSYKDFLPVLPANGWLVLMVLSFVPTLLGFGLYNTAMDYLPASIVNLLATSEPALTAVEAYIFLNERMTLIQIAGGVITILAVLIVRREKE